MNNLAKLFCGILSLMFAVSLFAATADEAVWIDFGRHDGGNGTATPSPDIFGKYWNSLSGGTGTVANNVVATNLVTASNNVSILSVTTTSTGWQNNGYLNGGLLTPNTNLLGEFGISNATGDYYFVSGAAAVGTMRVAGLDPARRYKFSMFACRTAADTRTTRYSVTDTNGLHTVTLQTTGTGAGSGANPTGNDDTIVELDQLIPNSSGQIDLSVAVVNGGFAYIGILKIVPVPATLVFIQHPQTIEVAPGTSTNLSVVVSGTPVNYRWYFTNALIPGATSSNLPLPSVSAANVGPYFVTASNAAGVVTSSVANVVLGPPHISGFSVLVDFGRHDGGVNGIETTSPDVNGNYWNNIGPSTTAVPQGTAIAGLVTSSNVATSVGITVISANFQCNGIVNGGLLTPHYSLLGDYAVPTATEDYFFLNNGSSGISGTIEISGLNPSSSYKLKMFATRNTDTNTTRTTMYSVTDVNGTHSVNLQTSGPGAGSTNQPFGNDYNVVSLNGLTPDGSGNLDLTVSEVNGLFAYLGILEITTADPAPFFVLQPQAVEVAAGTSTSMVAVAISPQPLTYRWYFNNTLIPGATSTNLPLLNVSNANVGAYFVAASNSLGVVTSSVANVRLGPPHLSGFSVLVDFGRHDGDVNGTETLSPDSNGHYWNNIGPTTINVPQGLAISGLVTMSNAPTTIGITVLSDIFQCNGRLNGGLITPHYSLLGDYAVGTATEDYFFLNNNTAGVSGTIEISGLDTNVSYKLKMFATRNTDVSTTRTTKYSVTDVNGTHSINLQTSGPGAGSTNQPYGNDYNVVSLNGLTPDASGNLDLTVSEVNGLFAYIGILEITTADPVPTFVLQPLSLEVAPGTSTSLVAYAVSPQPLSYKWYFNNSPIPGATSTNLPLPNLSGASAGTYYLVASNVFGVVTSSVASVLIGPAHLPSAAILVDFGRNDGGINGIETQSPDVNGNYWNNIGTPAPSVPQGLAISGLVTVANVPTPIALTVLSDTFQCNGIVNGGLLDPHYALLGDFAISTATEDYFHLNNGSSGIAGTLEISGLNPGTKYDLSMFATRTTDASTVRTTMYSVTDTNGTHSVMLQTSGPGAGSTNRPYGNDYNIVSLNGLVPDALGNLDLTVSEVSGLFAYIGVLKIIPNPQTVFTAKPTKITGGWHLEFNVGPNYSYRVQRALDVSGPWTDLGTFVGPVDGLGTYDDTNAPTSRAFYRVVVP